MDHQLAAAVIAGGRARRFGGRDKSRLIVAGRSIINRQLEVLQQVAPTVIVIADDASRFADLEVAVHPDLLPSCGALGGIYTALCATPADQVIVVASDLPFLDAALLRRLADLAVGHDGAWVRTAKGPEPLLACYAREAAPAIARQIQAGHLRASDLGAVLEMAELDEAALRAFGPPERLLANINTPEDYARIQFLNE